MATRDAWRTGIAKMRDVGGPTLSKRLEASYFEHLDHLDDEILAAAIAAQIADQAWALGQATADASGWSVSKAKLLALVPTRIHVPTYAWCLGTGDVLSQC